MTLNINEMGAYAPNRISRQDAEELKNVVIKEMAKNRINVFLAGSYRRNKTDFGDLDFIIIDSPLSKAKDVITNVLNVHKVARSGDSVITYVINHNDKLIQIETTKTTSSALGAAILHSTGSSFFNIALRSHAKKFDLKLNQYGLFKGNTLVSSRSEEEIFRALNLKYIPVSDRSCKDINSAYNVLRKYKIRNGNTMKSESFEHGIKTLKANQSVFDVKKSQYFRDVDLLVDFINTSISDSKLEVKVSRRRTSLNELKKAKGVVRTDITDPFVTKVELFSNVADLRNVWGESFLNNLADAIYKAANNPVNPTAKNTRKVLADPKDVSLANNISNPKSVDALNNLLKLANLDKEDTSSADTLKFIQRNPDNVLAMSAETWYKYFKKFDTKNQIKLYYQGTHRDGDTRNIRGGFTLVFMKYSDFNKLSTPYELSIRRNSDGIYLINKFRDLRLDATAATVLLTKGQGQNKPIKVRKSYVTPSVPFSKAPSHREAVARGFTGSPMDYATAIYAVKLFIDRDGKKLASKYDTDVDKLHQYVLDIVISNYLDFTQSDVEFKIDSPLDKEIVPKLRQILK